MKLRDLPNEIIQLVLGFLEIVDYKNVRLALRTNWSLAHVNMYSKKRLKLNKSIDEKKIYRCMRCMECKEPGLSQLIYTDGFIIKHIPWCELHVDEKLLENIEIFCTKFYPV